MISIESASVCGGIETIVAPGKLQEVPQEDSIRYDSELDTAGPSSSPTTSTISATNVSSEDDDLVISPCQAVLPPMAAITSTIRKPVNPLCTIIERAMASRITHLRMFLGYLLRTDHLTFSTKSGASCPWRIPYESTLLFSKVNLRLDAWEKLTPTQRANLAETALRPAIALGVPPSIVLDLIARFQKRSYVGPTGRYKPGYHDSLVKKHGLAALAAKLVQDRDVLIPALTGTFDESKSYKAIRARLFANVASLEARFFESMDHAIAVLRPDAMKIQVRAGKSFTRRLLHKKTLAIAPGPLRNLSTKDIVAKRDAKFQELVTQWERWEAQDHTTTETAEGR